MDKGKWGCFKTTAIGCGIAGLAAIAFVAALAAMIVAPLNDAVDHREALEKAYGAQEDYVPPASGAPSADRIEAFMTIQRELGDVCADLEVAEENVARLDALDDSEDVGNLEAVGMVWSTTRSMMGVGPVIGHLYETRNRMLRELEMGLGEFTYVFVLAFHRELLDPSYEPELFGPGPVNSRVRAALRSMLVNQLAALQDEGGSEMEISLIRTEIENLDRDHSKIPWEDGLPPRIDAAFAPYREELADLFSPAAAPLELMVNEKRGLGIESN